jgi:hypothetical protein
MAQGEEVKGKGCAANVEGTMAQESRIGLQKVSRCAYPMEARYQPAFRFLYTEENVARDPTRTAMYAKGTVSPIQSISNIVADLYPLIALY